MMVLCVSMMAGLVRCAGLDEFGQPPAATVESMRIERLAQDQCALNLRLALANTSPVTVAYRRLTLRLESARNGRPWTHHRRIDLLLPGYASTSSAFSFRLPAAGLRKLLGPDGRGLVRISGTLKTADQRPATSFYRETALALPQAPEVRMEQASLDQGLALFHVHNPNPVPLTLAKLEGRIVRNGRSYFLELPRPLTIPARSRDSLSATAVAQPLEEPSQEMCYGQLEFTTPEGLVIVHVLDARQKTEEVLR